MLSKKATTRSCIPATSLAAAGTALGMLANVHAAGDEIIKVGLIGCGNRGTGAAENCIEASPQVRIVAMGDTFADRLQKSKDALKKYKDGFAVKDEACFVGLDAYKKVLEAGVNLVILATPPGFRPLHLEAAVKAGKHIFAEKPVAVDSAGVRKCLEIYKQAVDKKLAIVVGTHRRHEEGYLDVLKQIKDGVIGEIKSARVYYNTGYLRYTKRTEKMSDLEWQIRNWLYFTWLSGDHIVEQHVHNIDVVNWFLGTKPISAIGMGGRQVRTDALYGHIFDHFAVDFEYPKGLHVTSMCRQIDKCEPLIGEFFVGTKGDTFTDTRRNYKINGKSIREKSVNPYLQEHIDLLASIKVGKPLNELKDVAESSLSAIMGRMCAYTGKSVTWDEALKAEESLMPAKLDWTMKLPTPAVAMPGKA